jgi:hypothetical protein
MGELRQAARGLTRELRADMGGISIPQEVALERIEQALVDDEPTTDELLRRLQNPPYHTLRLTFGTKWMARIEGDGSLLFELSPDVVPALRAVLLQLPAPTEPPPEGS